MLFIEKLLHIRRTTWPNAFESLIHVRRTVVPLLGNKASEHTHKDPKLELPYACYIWAKI